MKTPQKAIEKNKIRIYYYIGSISAILLIVILVSAIYSRSLYNEYQRKIDQLSSGIINEKKRFLKNAVDRTIGMIEIEMELVKNETVAQKMDEEIKEFWVERVSKRIRNLRLIDNGYVWVNRIVNYNGGDRYAIRQIHPNLPHTEGDWLSTETQDVKGNRPYALELEGVKKNGAIFFEYYFKKMGTDKIAHKMSYAKLYKPLDWVVATGVYLDDVDQLVRTETVKMKRTLQGQMLYSFSIAAIAFILSTLILMRFEKQISALIHSYEDDINDYTADLVRANKLIMEQRDAIVREERMKVLLQMAGATAHELNQPLMALKGNILLLALNREHPEKMDLHVARIQEASERISDVVSKIQTIKHDETVAYPGGASIIDLHSDKDVDKPVKKVED